MPITRTPLSSPSTTTSFNSLSSPTSHIPTASSMQSIHHHHKQSSHSSIATHLTLPSPIKQSTGPKRVWVKRPNATATTVFISENDIVDDFKGLILRKYPTTLARACDPADLVIKCPIPKRNSTIILSNADHLGKANLNELSEFDELILQPDESIYRIVEQHFPTGMAMKDAFIIDFNELVGSSNADIAMPSPIRPSPPDNLLHSSATTNTVSLLPPPVPQKNSPHHHQTPHSPQFYSPSPPPEQSHYYMKSPGTPSNTNNNINNSNTNNSNNNTNNSRANNGVLLLPRQFQLPRISNEKRVPYQRKKSSEEQQNNNEAESTKNEQNGTMIDGTIASNEQVILQSDTQNSLPSIDGTLANKPSPPSPATPGTRKQSDDKNSKLKRTMQFPMLEGVVVPQINVLIVEDNVINQKILETFMRKKKIRCAVAKNGKEAAEKWRQGGVHLILMDIQLPVMSGIEATKEIRRLEHDNHIGAFSHSAYSSPPGKIKPDDQLDIKLFRSPVIIVALTANSSSADKSEALAAGCNDFLTKPVNLAWLEQKTIEWGCMQALIDFEGWKHWVGKDVKKSNSVSSRKSRSRSQSVSKRQVGDTRRGGVAKLTALTKKSSSPAPTSRGRQLDKE